MWVSWVVHLHVFSVLILEVEVGGSFHCPYTYTNQRDTSFTLCCDPILWMWQQRLRLVTPGNGFSNLLLSRRSDWCPTRIRPRGIPRKRLCVPYWRAGWGSWLEGHLGFTLETAAPVIWISSWKWCTIEFQSQFRVLSWQEWHLVWSAPVAHLLLWLKKLKAFCAFSDINRAFSSRELPLTGCFLSFWIFLCKQTSSLWNIKTSLSDINNHAVFKVT